jgi:hypothetical protein
MRAHLQKKHQYVLSPDDYLKDELASLKSQYDQAIKYKRSNTKPPNCTIEFDARKKTGGVDMKAFWI